MIARLSGRIVDEGEGGNLVVDVNGVGYEVSAPLGTRGSAMADAGGNITLHVHTHVREDTFQLFGFASVDERAAFRAIIAVANVGPKLGISILGAVSVDELAAMVARGETKRLTTIPGVGKKTAERLVLELEGKLPVSSPKLEGLAGAGPTAAQPAEGSRGELLAGALTRMGFRPSEAERAVAALSQSRSLDEAPLGDLVREALALLAR
jgi:Holliday junction DNA helicase RuvA